MTIRSEEQLLREIDELRSEVARLKAADAARLGAEDALAQSELFSQALLRALPINIAFLDREGTIVGVNHAWERLARQQGANTLVQGEAGSNYLQLCREATGPTAVDAARCAQGLEAVQRGRLQYFNLLYVAESVFGKRWWLLRSVPLSRSSGGMIIANFDVTTEMAPEEQLRYITTAARCLLWSAVIDDIGPDQMHMVLSVADEAAARRFLPISIAPGQTFAEAWLDSRLPEEREAALRFTEEQIRAGRDYRQEFRCRLRDGSVRWLSEEVHVEAAGDRRWRAVGVCTDITDRKLGEDSLRNTAASFRLLFSNNPRPMFVCETDSLEFMEINEAAIATYGFSREEFLRMSLCDLIPADEAPRLRAALSGQEEDAGPTGQWHNRLKDGRLIDVEVTIHHLTFAGQNAALVIAENVTDRRHIEVQMLQAQKMDIIGRLASGLAHEFNNAFTAIMGYSGLAELELPLDHPACAYMQHIQKAATRASEHLNELLAFARRQRIEPRLVDLNGLMIDVDHLLRHLVGERVELVTIPRPKLGLVNVDPIQMKQVLINLADYARTNMPAGGKLVIETDNVSLDEDYARHHVAVMPGEYVLLSVSDTGHGMTENARSQIFEPFFSTAERGEEGGLGLATSYGIVKQSGGYIWAYSEEGHGTTFKIYLPRVDEAAREWSRQPTNDNLPRGTETVMIVDDEPLNRSIAIRTLRNLGYGVLEASDGHEAQRLAKSFVGRIDLLMTDLVLPQMGGKELAAKLQEDRPQLRVLLTSGYTGAAAAAHNGGSPDEWFVAKPYAFSVLANKVRDVLDTVVKPA